MAVNFEENPIGTALGAAPDAIIKALQYRQAKASQDQEMQMNKQAMEQARMQLKQQEKALGMDRGGYNNQALEDYFMNITMAPVNLVPDASGNYMWDNPQVMPTQAEAWQQYQNIVGPANITAADSRYFMTELWPQAMETRSGNVVGELKKLQEGNFSERDIRLIMMNNPALRQNVGLVLKHTKDPALKGQLAKYLPQKPIDITGQITSLGPTVGLVGMGAAVAAEALSRTSPDDIKKATEQFEKRLADRKNPIDATTRSSKRLDKIKTDLEKAKKRKANTPKSVKSKATRIQNLTKKSVAEKSNINRIIERATRIQQGRIAQKTYFKKSLPHLKKMGFPAAAFAPTVLGTGGEYIAGEPGRAIGRGFGGAAQLGYGTAKGVSLAKYLMKVIPRIAGKKAVQGLGMAASDLALPFGDVAGLTWGIGSGSAEIYRAYKDWKLANQQY